MMPNKFVLNHNIFYKIFLVYIWDFSPSLQVLCIIKHLIKCEIQKLTGDILQEDAKVQLDLGGGGGLRETG